MASLKDKYCIAGVGETEYSRKSGRSTRAMAVEAIKHAMAELYRIHAVEWPPDRRARGDSPESL